MDEYPFSQYGIHFEVYDLTVTVVRERLVNGQWKEDLIYQGPVEEAGVDVRASVMLTPHDRLRATVSIQGRGESGDVAFPRCFDGSDFVNKPFQPPNVQIHGEVVELDPTSVASEDDVIDPEMVTSLPVRGIAPSVGEKKKKNRRSHKTVSFGGPV
jgi:hypothetical protein